MTLPDLQQVSDDLDRLGPLVNFPWHKQQQFALAISTDVGVIQGGTQCLGGEQEVYDPVAQRLRRVDSITEPWHVWAWDGEKLVVAEASIPFPKDAGLLCRYELSNGESFVAATTHHVLCADGEWRPCSDLRQGSSLFLPASTSGIGPSVPPSSVRHSTQRVPDSRCGCPACSCSDGGQPPCGVADGRGAAPSPADAQGRSGCACAASPRTRSGRSRPCPRWNRRDRTHVGVPESGSCRASGSPAGESVARLAAVASPSAPPRHAETGLASLPSPARWQSPRGSDSASQAQGLPDVLVVHNVVPLRVDTKWDLTVPGYANYWLAGAIHHNSGKTAVATGIVSRLIRREGPIYRRLRKVNERPLKIWVAPQTLEKFKSNWERRLLSEAFSGIEVDYTQSPFPVFRWHDGVTRKLAEGKSPDIAAGLRNELWCKSHDQGPFAFESDVVDLVIFDEEPQDRRLYASAKTRGTTVNGVVLFAFTPIHGMTWTHDEFYQPTVKDSYKLADRVWRRGRSVTVVQMGMADNPEAVAGGGVDRILNDPGMTQAEKNTRLYGEYGFAEGLIWPDLAGVTNDSDSIYLVDSLPDGPKSWTFTADPNKRNGAALTCLDVYGNTFLVDEHYLEGVPDQVHAEAYKAILKRHHVPDRELILGADPGGAGAQAILNMAAYGLHFSAVPKDAGSVAASIKLVRSALWVDPNHPHPVTGKLGAPRFYVLRTVRSQWTEGGVPHNQCRFLYEARQYRQKDKSPPDTPIKLRDDVVDTVRYAYLMRPYSPEPPDPVALKVKEERSKLDPLSREAAEEMDEMESLAHRFRQHSSSGTDNSA